MIRLRRDARFVRLDSELAMVEHERGTYDPMDEIRVFDGSMEDDDHEGSRLPILVGIALVVLASFAGVVWLAYEKGVASGRSEPQIVAANPQEDSVQAGHAPMQYKGLKIYDQPAPDDADQAGSAQGATPPGTTVATAAPSGARVPVAQLPAFRPPVAETSATKPPVAKVAAPAPALVRGGSQIASAAPLAQPVPQAGALFLQIGSYKSQDEADAAWTADKVKFGELLTGLRSDVLKVDLGARGTWYRLRIASLSDKTAAMTLCEKLKAGGATCFLTK